MGTWMAYNLNKHDIFYNHEFKRCYKQQYIFNMKMFVNDLMTVQ